MKKRAVKQSPIERTISNKENLILKGRKEVEAVRQKAADRIKVIEQRIKMTQIFVEALKKGIA
jgi:hypothetical protein